MRPAIRAIFIIFLSLFCFNKLQAQVPCTSAHDAKAIVSNLVCVAGDHLTFDLTLTFGGTPYTPISGSGIKITSGGGVAATTISSISGGSPINNVSVTTNSGSGCDISTFYVQDQAGALNPCNPFLSLQENVVPTLGQWGLIILGLILSIFGVMALAEKRSFTKV